MELSRCEPEDLKPLNFARCNWFPRRAGNRPISPATMHRWVRKGIHGVRLRVLRLPSGTVTTQAAVQEFLAAVDAARRAAESDAIDASDADLRRAGLIGAAK